MIKKYIVNGYDRHRFTLIMRSFDTLKDAEEYYNTLDFYKMFSPFDNSFGLKGKRELFIKTIKEEYGKQEYIIKKEFANNNLY